MRAERRPLVLTCLLLALPACQPDGGATAKSAAPARVDNPPKEADLSTVTLSERAEQRLGVQVAAVQQRRVERVRTFSGEVVVPAGRSIVVSASVAGTVLGNPLGAGAPVTRGQAVLRLAPLPPASELSTAGVRAEVARKKAARLERLMQAGAASQRALDDANAELELAQATLDAGRGRSGSGGGRALAIEAPQAGLLTQVMVGPGQAVGAGAPLFQVDGADSVWVRVAVYAGELGAVDRARPARVRPLSAPAGSPPGREAPSALAPPSADPRAATGDLHYQLDNRDGAFRPGQKVDVALPLTGDEEASLTIPYSAVVYDVHGGAWVYERRAPRVYSRRRVEVARVVGDWAVLARGPKAGTPVVVNAVAELYGTEFGNGK